MSENYVDREEAEKIIEEAIEDFIDIGTLQDILDLIFGGEFIVVEEHDKSTDDELD